MNNPLGVFITSGPSDWQIVQRDDNGLGSLDVAGVWHGRPESKEGAFVQVRLVHQDTGSPILASLNWQTAQMLPGNAWSATLTGIPAGGLYRLETHLEDQDVPAYDWAVRGDMRHFLGVGDIWVIAGQSNSAGYGRGPICDPPDLGIHLFRNNLQWSLASHPLNESTGTEHELNRETANPGHSPYLNFARVLKQHLGCPIGLVQTALGGSPLTSWNPTEPGDSPLFEMMVASVKSAGGKVKGVVWYQGESDCNMEQGPTYEARFGNAVAAWRQALDNPRLAVATVQPDRVKGAGPGDDSWSIVREAQRQCARKLAGVVVIPAHDQTLTDAIHISPAGNIILGDRLARAALQNIYGVDIDGAVPDLANAAAVDGGRGILLRFDNISSFINTLDTAAQPYAVRDADGVVDVAAITYPERDKVHLALARPLSGPATILAGLGCDPPALPIDMQRILPVLAFYGVPVEAEA